MAVRIRMKKMGRTHRPFYRICAFDHHAPRDGRPIEELGIYDTSISDTDARAVLKNERVDYWLSVGAQPSEKVAVLIKKYGSQGTRIEEQKQAIERLAAPQPVADPGKPASLPKKPEEPKPEEAKTEEAAAKPEQTAKAPAEPKASAETEAPAAKTEDAGGEASKSAQ